jgi:hypothetical protein
MMEFMAVDLLPRAFDPSLLAALLYIGPDAFLPLASALAAVAGALLMFWQRIVSFVGNLFGRGSAPKPAERPSEKQD